MLQGFRRGRVLSGVVVALGAALLGSAGSASAAAGDWTQPGGDAGQTNVSTGGGALTPANAAGLHLLSSVPSQPVNLGAVVGGVNYAYATLPGSNPQFPVLEAQSLADGHALWTQTSCGTAPLNAFAAPTVGPTAIWISDGQKFTVISRATHRVVACVDTPKVSPTFARTVGPTQYGDAVFMAHGNKILSFAEATGARRWQVTLPFGQVRVTPAVDSGLVFVAATGVHGRGGWVFALSASDGHLVWTYHQAAGLNRVDVSNGRVFLGPTPGALNASTGQLLWSKPALNVGNYVSPSTDGVRVYYVGDEATCCEGELMAFDTATGQRLWSTFGVVPSAEGEGSIIIAGGLLFLSDVVGDGSDAVVEASTGRIVTRIPAPSSDYYSSESVLVAGSVYKITGAFTPGSVVLQRWGL